MSRPLAVAVPSHRPACWALLMLVVGLLMLAPTARAQTPLPAAQATPSVKIGTATLVTPADADAFYAGLSSAHTTSVSTPPPDIAALASALHGDKDLIYDYVRNNTET